MKKLTLTPVHDGHGEGSGDADTRPIDPVCGMRVTRAKAAGSHVFEGVTYYFCAQSCLTKFQASPRAYLKGQGSHTTPPDPTGTRSAPATGSIPVL